MSKELAVYESHDFGVIKPPEEVLAEAQRAAKALADVVSKKKKPVVINNEQYLEFEDWQTVGRFYGITAKITQTQYIDYGNVQGFEAKAVAIKTSDGMEISAAEAMCLNDEPNWKDKPLFQLRSMSQTRACAKALRNVLAWVVVLAGYKPTPAEEIQNVVQDKPPIMPPQAKKQTQADAEGNITVKAVIEKTSSKEGKKGNKTWTLYGILADGVWYNTFSKTFHDIATAKIGKTVEIVYQVSEKGNTLVAINVEGWE
ncbi:MAG: hypothetical protein DDT22_00940 [candidate division WS2 bacterium]|nr:hypothetical protein [Bacillota bacterium]MBT9175266.1 hypothetical protein [Candidatus Lithacetigena glycinireducens]